MSERHVDFDACWNFRDIGGYENLDGQRVRTGVVFRSDDLYRLTTADLEIAGALGLRTVVDLRSSQELAGEGRYAHADDVAFHHLPLFEYDALPFELAKPDDPEPPPGEDYVAIATSGCRAIASALQVIAQGEYALVFHCAAGKDRTGIIAALLLSMLGVPDNAIVADYELSERALPRAIAWAESNSPALAEEISNTPTWLLRSSGHKMQAFLDQLRERHGSIEQYLLDAGVGRDAMDTLRARLLQPA